jgi:hypothetical protein
MSLGLKARIRNAALADVTLLGLLGTVSPASLRWFDTQLLQGAAFPAVVVMVVSNPETTTNQGALPTTFARVQYTIWCDDTSAGATQMVSIINGLYAFFKTLNLIGMEGLTQYPNRVVLERDGLYAQTQPPKLQHTMDVMQFWNNTIDS